MVGKAFGRLIVLSKADKVGRSSNAYWNTVCICGNTSVVRGDSMRDGSIKSCGCLKKESAMFVKHGCSTRAVRTPEYMAWGSMIQRCENPNNPRYPNYGGRGIKVCDRWRNSFQDFLEDMGEKPHESLSLDRINNDGNYKLANCRWATINEQANNQRHNMGKERRLVKYR